MGRRHGAGRGDDGGGGIRGAEYGQRGAGLLEAAATLVPALSDATFVEARSGLRPATAGWPADHRAVGVQRSRVLRHRPLPQRHPARAADGPARRGSRPGAAHRRRTRGAQSGPDVPDQPRAVGRFCSWTSVAAVASHQARWRDGGGARTRIRVCEPALRDALLAGSTVRSLKRPRSRAGWCWPCRSAGRSRT